MRLLVALLGFLLLMPLAAAQAPLADVCGPITTTVSPPARALAAGESGTVTLTIRNDGAVPVQASASMNVQSAGWDFDAEAPAAAIAAGDSKAFSFTATPRESVTADTTATLIGRATCEAPAGGVACPADQCTFERTEQVTLRFRQAEGLDIPFLQNLAFPPEYLIAGLVLVGLVTAIIVLARRPAKGIHADCPEPLKMVAPGRGASFPIEIRNDGAAAKTARLRVGAVPAGWSAFLALPDVQLAPRESRRLFLMVRAPADAMEGNGVDVEIKIVEAGNGDGESSVRVRAEVKEGYEGPVGGSPTETSAA